MKTYNRGNKTKLSANFNVSEFECKCGKCKGTVIDSQLVTYLQLIRNHFGKPVYLNSAYRCADHNRAVGGSKGSYHMLGRAADIRIDGVEPKEVAKYAESIGVKGIGVYKTFTHIDTRATKYFWYDGGESNVSTFGGSVANLEPIVVSKITVSLPTLKAGSKNKYVFILQALLGAKINGSFDEQTQAAVKAYQKQKGLTQDGIVGKATWTSLFD